MPNADGNESGISEIQLKLKNAEWKLIGNKKRWIGNCPNCKIQITYSQKAGLKRALEENRVCLSCRQDKIKHTCQVKYGSNSPLECDKIFNKTLETCKRRYGKPHAFQNNYIQSKVKSHLIHTYGVDSPSKLSTHKLKIQKRIKEGAFKNAYATTSNTKLLKYNNKHYNNIEKCRNTFFDRYGVDHPFKIKEIREKAKITLIKKYGKTLQELAADGWKNKNTNIELKIKSLLEKYNIGFRRNFHIYDRTLKNHRFYDFQIDGTSLLIEADGDYWHSLPHNIINDKYKDRLANCHNFILLRFKERDIMSNTFEDIFISILNENIKLYKTPK